MTMLFIMGILLVFTALGWSALPSRNTSPSTGVARSIEVIEAMTTAPHELKAELDKSFSERVPIPLQNRFAGLVDGGRVPIERERIRRKLDLAGNPPGWTVEPGHERQGRRSHRRLCRRPAVLVHARQPDDQDRRDRGDVTLAGFFAPSMYLYQRTYDRSKRIQRELPDAIDLLTISVESGLGFDAALQQVARNTEGPLADEFSGSCARCRSARRGGEALRALAERTQSAPSCGPSSTRWFRRTPSASRSPTCCACSRPRCASSADNAPRRRPSRSRSR